MDGEVIQRLVHENKMMYLIGIEYLKGYLALLKRRKNPNQKQSVLLTLA